MGYISDNLRDILVTSLILVVVVSAAAPAAASIDSIEGFPETGIEYHIAHSTHKLTTSELVTDTQSFNDSVQVVEGETDRVDDDGRIGEEENGDGDPVFASIQAAIDNAEEGETVRVLPGTYRERVEIKKNITLVAPRGATLNGSTFETRSGGASGPFGIQIGDNVSPTIDGFTITRYADAILDYQGSGDWTVTNVTVLDTRDDGIGAQFTTGNWTIKNTVIDNTSRLGVHVGRGDWTIENTTIRNVPEVGISKEQESGGNWTVTNTTIKNSGAIGIRVYPGNLTVENSRIINGSYAGISSNRFATYSDPVSGTWTIKNTTIHGSKFGVFDAQTSLHWTVTDVNISGVKDDGIVAVNSSGNWTVRSTTIRRSGQSGVRLSRSRGNWIIEDSRVVGPSTGGVVAIGVKGQLTIRNTSFVDYRLFGINAQGAERTVEATQNWWGTTEGPASGDCLGTVTCQNWLRTLPNGSVPNESTNTEEPSGTPTVTPTETETQTPTKTETQTPTKTETQTPVESSDTARPSTGTEQGETLTTTLGEQGPGFDFIPTILAVLLVTLLAVHRYR